MDGIETFSCDRSAELKKIEVSSSIELKGDSSRKKYTGVEDEG